MCKISKGLLYYIIRLGIQQILFIIDNLLLTFSLRTFTLKKMLFANKMHFKNWKILQSLESKHTEIILSNINKPMGKRKMLFRYFTYFQSSSF